FMISTRTKRYHNYFPTRRSSDLFTVADPFNAAAEVRGVGRIHRFLGDIWRDHACCALLVHEDLIERDPVAVQSLTDSLVSAQLQDRKSTRLNSSYVKISYAVFYL